MIETVGRADMVIMKKKNCPSKQPMETSRTENFIAVLQTFLVLMVSWSSLHEYWRTNKKNDKPSHRDSCTSGLR